MSDIGSVLYGFDSSLTHFGFAVAEHRGYHLKWLSVGVIVTEPDAAARKKSKTDDNRRRVEGIAWELRRLVERYGAPSVVAVEALALPLGKTSKVTVSALGRARGLVDMLAVSHGQSAREFAPQSLKRIVTGNPNAPKADVDAALCRAHPGLDELLAQVRPANREHAADACAAIHAATQVHAAPHQEG